METHYKDLSQELIRLRCQIEWYKGFLEGIAQFLKNEHPELYDRVAELTKEESE